MKNMRLIGLVVAAISPWFIKKKILKYFFDYKFHEKSRIGFSFVDVDSLIMHEGSSVGSFTIIRNLHKLELGKRSKIGTFNWIFGMRESNKSFSLEVNRLSALIIGEHSAITSRHLIDCIDAVEIGAFTTIAGFRTQILTHSIDLSLNRQSCAPVKIGSYCFVGTGAIILKGISIPDKCVVAAGSVVSKSILSEGFIYGGNPAGQIRAINSQDKYFSRNVGGVQ